MDKQTINTANKLIRKAQEQGAKQFKRNKYHVRKIKCCLTCCHAEYGYEGEMSCAKIKNPDYYYDVASVDALGHCNKYEIEEE